MKTILICLFLTTHVWAQTGITTDLELNLLGEESLFIESAIADGQLSINSCQENEAQNCQLNLNIEDLSGLQIEALESLPPEIEAAQNQESNPVPSNTKPLWWKVTAFGFGMAPTQFIITSMIHDASVATAARASGVRIEDYEIFDEENNDDILAIGRIRLQNNLSPRQAAMVATAPFIANTAIIGTYGALALSGQLPQNPYAQMGLWIFTAGQWVDMGRDLFSRDSNSSSMRLERVLQENGMRRQAARFIVRGSQSLVFSSGAYFLAEGMRQIFLTTSHPRIDERSDRRTQRRSDRRVRRHRARDLFDRFNMSVDPDVSPGYTGLSITGQF